MGSSSEFWALARRRPFSATFAAMTIAVFSAGLVVASPALKGYIAPSNFTNISSDYVGTLADSGAFHLCFAAFGSKVLGEMTFEGSGKHIDYWGDIDKDKNQLILHYVGAIGMGSLDHGDALLSSVGTNDLQGYYQSNVYPQNHQTLDLERTGRACDLRYFEHGW
jgi:hypothetical protein